MDIKIKKLNENAVIPKYAYSSDACMDITAISKKIVEKGGYGYVEYGTGLAFSIPDGHVMLLFPRSSVSNKGLILSNAVGVIDPGYTGEVTVRFKHIKGGDMYDIGDKVCQLMVAEIPNITFQEVDDLGKSDRGENGYGSTGK